MGTAVLDGVSEFISAEHGLLVVNHEYTNAEIMFPKFASVVKETKDGKEEEKVKLGE